MKNNVISYNNYSVLVMRDGEQVLVDTEDIPLLADYKWHIDSKSQEPMANTKIEGVAFRIKMKILLLGEFKNSKSIHYLDRNPLNNRKSNLTYCANPIHLYDDYAIIETTEATKKILKFKIDLDDVDKVKKYSWSLSAGGYLFRREKRKNIFLHNYILGVKRKGKDIWVDHIDRNPLNNMKSNLRVCTMSQNNRNQSKRNINNPTSKYKGVSWDKGRKAWRVRIVVEGKEMLIGHFNNEEVAAFVYNQSAIEKHKEFSCLNEVESFSNDEVKRHTLTRKVKSHTSFRGITFHKYSQKWICCYKLEGKYYHVGSFNSEEEAARAFNEEVISKGLNFELNLIK